MKKCGTTGLYSAFCILLMFIFNPASGQSVSYNMSRQEVLESLILNSTVYNARIAPDYERDHATTVDVQIFVLSIDTVNEQSMDYSLHILLRQRWKDPRLSYKHLSKAVWLELDAKLMSKVWVPDTFFRNEKKGQFHDVTVPNRLMHLYGDGTIYYSIRLSVVLSCHMRLEKYPLDIQKCPILIASYGYTTENIIYKWIGKKSIDYNDNLELSQYTLVGEELGNCTKTYKLTGSFSCVRADFILKRDVGYYIIQVYVPSVLIVILSWVSFWLDVEAIPARISLGVLTVLTMTTQSSGARSTLPRVSYVKAIDVWMATCLFFVFASLLEFAYINVLARRRGPYRCCGCSPSAEASPGSNGSYPLRQDCESAEKPRLSRQQSRLGRSFGKAGARYIDRCSRFLFPAAFVVFNIIYWLMYTLVDI